MFPIAAPLPQDRTGMPLAPVPRESADVEHPTAIGFGVSERMVSAVGYRPAPDPPRQGATATRRARFWRSWTWTFTGHEQDALLGSSRRPVIPNAQGPRGRQAPHQQRTNIYRAPFQTYSEAQDAGAPGLSY